MSGFRKSGHICSLVNVFSDIRSCCCQSVYTFTSRCDSTLLGCTYLTPKLFLHELNYTHSNVRIYTCIADNIHTAMYILAVTCAACTCYIIPTCSVYIII